MRGSFWILKQIYICTRGLLSRVSSKSTYMAFVMQGLDLCLSLDQARMVKGLNEELGRHRSRMQHLWGRM